MSSIKKGLGRGLDALFENNNNTILSSATVSDVATIHIDLLVTNANQPRKYFDEQALQELADSIASQGIIQPLLVRPIEQSDKYEIVAGERRYRAALKAELKSVPVYIRKMTDLEVMAASLIENVQREDLNPIEQALGLKRLRDEFMIIQDELAKIIGKSRSAVANSLRLLNLSDHAQKNLIRGEINTGHARALLSIDDQKAQNKLLEQIINNALTVRDAENAAKDWKNGLPFYWENEATTLIIKKPQKKTNRLKPENIKLLQKQLNEKLNFRANISGTEDKGRITLSYQNTIEFEMLLEKLGIQK